MTHDALAGRRVLVVEDEPIIAMMQVTLLESTGCMVLGPVRRVDRALHVIAEQGIDLALLDIDLGNEKVFPVADALAWRGVPFVFLTGYGSVVLPSAHRTRRCLVKPCEERELLGALREALHADHRTTA